MNYLQLATKLRQECQLSGTGPVSVVGQTGHNKLIVDWIDDAYQNIQNLKWNWDFLREDVSFVATSGTGTYTAAEAGITDYGEWKMDSFRTYKDARSNELFLFELEWRNFRNAYLFSNLTDQVGRPYFISQKPDTSLIMWPAPDDTYTIVGEYFKEPHELTVNTDIPLIPKKYHLMIVYRAMMFFGVYANAQEIYASGEREYKNLLFKMEQSQIPPAVHVETMA